MVLHDPCRLRDEYPSAVVGLDEDAVTGSACCSLVPYCHPASP